MHGYIRRFNRHGQHSGQQRLARSKHDVSVGGWLRSWIVLVALAALLAFGQRSATAGEIVGSGFAALYGEAGTGHEQGPFVGGVNLNDFLGAYRFYDAGLTGTRALMANVEAGHVWSAHETLAHVQQIPAGSGSVLAEADRHATWVAAVMGGRPVASNPGNHQTGIAPGAQFYSGAIATNWSGTRFSTGFSFSFGTSTFGPYRDAFSDGLAGVRTADVVNSSWNAGGGGSDTGTNQLAGTLDALANDNPRTLMTVAAGNSLPTGEGPNRVLSPATAYNNMSVAALGPASTGYSVASFFSNGGPNNYSDPVTGMVSFARQSVDIAAPGENIAAAYYGGETGGNRAALDGGPDGPAGGADWYSHSVRGTSFAAPIVAGGAALLYDAAYSLLADTADARDARVIKAVLMNSAEKTDGWNNGQLPHSNGNGGVFTIQGLDDRVGAGRMNLDRAYDQFLSGTTDVKGTSHDQTASVDMIGWDFGEVAEGFTNDYLIDEPLPAGSEFNATLTWFRDRGQVGSTNFSDQSYDNLDLELWSADAGVPLALVSESRSLYNNSEHFSFAIPKAAEYVLRVRWTGEVFDMVGDLNREQYGLAWSTSLVPEPSSLVLLLMGVLAIGVRRR
jgi:hypothetical protein